MIDYENICGQTCNCKTEEECQFNNNPIPMTLEYDQGWNDALIAACRAMTENYNQCITQRQVDVLRLSKNSPEGHLESIANKCTEMTNFLDSIPHNEITIEMNFAIEKLYSACQTFRVVMRYFKN